MSGKASVFFRFAQEVAPAARKKLVRDLKRQGAADVRRLFPRNEDPTLSSLYVLDVAPRVKHQALVRTLRASGLIDLVQTAVRRWPN